MSVYRPPKARGQRAKAPGVAFYDLDGTLVDLNLVHATLYLLANLGEWSGRIRYLLRFATRIPMLHLAEQRDRYLLNVVLFETFRGVSRDRLEALGDEYCDRTLARHLYPQAREMIEGNRAVGLEPVLVTGSPDFIVAPLAERLQVKDFATNRLVYSRGRATGRLRAPVMAGEAKAQWCAEYAEAKRLDLASCWSYADSHYDLPFLAVAGHPVAVNPDRRLSVTARSRQWPILRFAKAQNGSTASAIDETPDDSWIGRALNGAARG
jgi:HAD superfamily hydrolase (TIGR01490 family)